ncbi:MAG: hypothetical protein L6290_06515 [Thermodesulfovibrionales bacterium]|nr:hypothetical protein [Thermodesulfovibrionales bacterium]
MYIMKMLIQNITVLNMLLILGIIFFALQSLLPHLSIQVRYAVPSAGKSLTGEQERSAEISVPAPTEYGLVAERNLFHPERHIPVEKKAEQPLPKPEFVLYGTMITDGLSLAYVEDLKAPRSSPGRGKRQTSLKKGDRISGFTLKEIHSDNIVLMRGDEKLVVSIQDSSHPKARTEFGVSESTAESPPASASKPPSQQHAPKSLPQRVMQPSNPSSPQAAPPRPERRLGSQKTFRPQAPGR